MTDEDKAQRDLATAMSLVTTPKGAIPLASYVSVIYLNSDGEEVTGQRVIGVESIGKLNVVGGVFTGLVDFSQGSWEDNDQD